MNITAETVLTHVDFAKNIKEEKGFVFFDFSYEEELAHVRVKDDLSIIEVKCRTMSKELEEGFEQEITEKLTGLA
ncbi:hypothetical protein [Bacillus sp. MUM 13]|uniref:hypothetical protein n=1 Tax=Bacillus sp. MUM 13 TaxID=1678001 RepID=UPI0008F5D993|nr:hypothetical protein [Bacillus sp. MUM 13]OIK12423.1 hypothetical protein BIV59_08955 [Bacillus sp. MUM 13]